MFDFTYFILNHILPPDSMKLTLEASNTFSGGVGLNVPSHSSKVFANEAHNDKTIIYI